MPTLTRVRPPTAALAPLWRKAPFVLVRFPGLLAALAVGALLLSLTVSAYPLFLDGSSSEILREEISNPLVTRHQAGVSYLSTSVPLGAHAPGDAETPLHERRGELFAERASASGLLGPTIAAVVGPVVTVAPADRPSRDRTARLFAGTDAVRHVRVVEGEEGPGVWVPDTVAGPIGVGPGDTVKVRYEASSIEVPVDGVYRSLYTQPRSGYWLRWDAEIYPLCEVGSAARCAPPPPFLLLDEPDAIATLGELGVPTADFGWEAPLEAPASLTLSEAGQASAFVADFRRAAADTETEFGRVMHCCRRFFGGFSGSTEVSSDIDLVLTIVDQKLARVEGPGRLLEIVAALVSLVVIGAGGAFGASARRTEARLLLARGSGAGTLAGKAAVESVLPCIVGSVLGFGVALALVAGLGPSGTLGGGAVADAAAVAALAAAAAVVVVAIATVAMSLGHSDYHRSRFQILSRLPWELALVAFAVFAFREVRLEIVGADLRSLEGVAPTLYLFLFPIAGIGGMAVLGARLFRGTARWLRDRGRPLRPPAYLAIHRLSDTTGLALLLFAASTLAMGIFIQGRTVVGSLDRAVDQKADVFVGSDVQAWVSPDQEVPRGFPLPATKVVRVAEAGTLIPGGVLFDLLAIDPATFADAAAWSDAFSDEPLEVLTERLEASGDAAPVVVVGTEIDVTQVEMTQRTLLTETVGHAGAFPGMVSRRPMIVMDRALLEREFEGATGPLDDADARPEIWIRGGHDAATAAAYTLDFPPYSVFGVDDVKHIPYIEAVIDMFAVLDALGLGAALLVVVALAMYLQARQRAQLVAYGLSRRMGMSRAAHRRSLAAEVGSVLASSWAFGTALAVGVGLLIVPLLDPLPSVPPDPFVRPPLSVAAAALVGIVTCSWLAARIIEARARSSYLGEVLRVDE